MSRRTLVSTALALLVVLAAVLAFRRLHRTDKGWLAAADAGASEPEVVEWCAPGLDAIPGGGCFAAPADALGTKRVLPLIIYLHGIFDPAAASEELDRQARVAARGIAHGFAVLALRGHVGQCSAPEYASRVCWPSNEHN